MNSEIILMKEPFDHKNAPLQSSDINQPPVWILYGTHTGNSEMLAEETADKLKEIGLESKIYDMESIHYDDLINIKRLLIIVSTDGDGEPPLMAEEFLEYLNSDKAPRLGHMKYSVLALGDTSYDLFCQAGKDFDTLLEQLGASRISIRVDCDVDYEDNYDVWVDQVLNALKCSNEN